MLVYVLNKNGNKLMPCKPAKARKLLRDKKARIVNHVPFTIQLTWDCEENVQEVIIGIDKGAKYTGFCAICKQGVLISGVINHRCGIKERIENRAGIRRQRRSRLWYRKPRFKNRGSSKRSGRLPPSIKANVEEVVRVINKLPIPLSNIIVEDVLIDIAKLNNLDLQGVGYQQSERLNENLRLACLLRDNFTCQYCKKKNIKLEAHHIIPVCKGGKDSIKNLITLCNKDHTDLHKGKITIGIKGVSGFADKMAQRTMQGKKYLYNMLDKFGDVATIFGYQTSEYRKEKQLEKDHDIDAFCVANYFNNYKINYDKSHFFNVTFRPRQTRKCYFDLPRRSIGRVKYKVNESLNGFKKGDIVMIKNKWVKQINSIYSSGYLAFKRIKGEPSSALTKDCKLLLKQKTIVFNTI